MPINTTDVGFGNDGPIWTLPKSPGFECDVELEPALRKCIVRRLKASCRRELAMPQL